MKPTCPSCGASGVIRTSASGKFWCCPNWKPRNGGCPGFTKNVESGDELSAPKNLMQLTLPELQALVEGTLSDDRCPLCKSILCG